MVEETVGYDEETVKFNKAVKWVKRSHRLFYKDIAEQIGLTKEQGEQIRAGKRRASDNDIKTLIKHFPESAKFFSNTGGMGQIEGLTQTLNEPMATHHFYGKTQTPDPWQQLAETQKELIDKQREELAALKERVRQLELEKTVLTSTIEGILSTKK